MSGAGTPAVGRNEGDPREVDQEAAVRRSGGCSVKRVRMHQLPIATEVDLHKKRRRSDKKKPRDAPRGAQNSSA